MAIKNSDIIRVAYLYRCKGRKYKYFIKSYKELNNRHMLRDCVVLGHVIEDRAEKKTRQTQARRVVVSANFDWPYFGVHKDDQLVIEESGEPPVGKLVRIKVEGEGRHFINRVCSVHGDIARVSDDVGNWEDVPLSFIVGPVVEIKHSNCNQTKIEVLRARLAKLQDDDEHTLSYTKCFEVEKEIYDLEHPLEEDGEDFEWPDEIDDKGVL